MKFLFDLDDTLIASSKLNTDAYNYALESLGYQRLDGVHRITRENLKCIPPVVSDTIIRRKQEYFAQAWLPCRILLNDGLLAVAMKNGRQNCFLWTRARKERAEAVLTMCNLNRYFKSIIYDEKKSFRRSMEKLRAIIGRDDFLLFEDNVELLQYPNVSKVCDINMEHFHYAIYLVQIK